jgi:ATP-dependent protease HslVU (ClpYQ) peptidase subunit
LDAVTTIAARFSTREIAADSMISGEDTHYATQKLRKKRLSIIGAAGEWKHVLEFYKRLQTRKSLENDCDISAIELRHDGIWVYESTIIPTRIEQDYFAIGTGSGYAIAAMYLGKTPKEAVEIAALFDPCTRGPITVMSLRKTRGNKSK